MTDKYINKLDGFRAIECLSDEIIIYSSHLESVLRDYLASKGIFVTRRHFRIELIIEEPGVIYNYKKMNKTINLLLTILNKSNQLNETY